MSHQIVRAQPATLTATWTDIAGDLIDPGVVTVTIARLDASAVVTDAPTTGTLATARTYDLTPLQTGTLDTFTATFTSDNPALASVIVTAEIVGDVLFTIAQVRAFDRDPQSALLSETKYPDDWISDERARIGDLFDGACGLSFIERHARVIHAGDGDPVLPLVRDDGRSAQRVNRLRAVETREVGSTTWTLLTAAELSACMLDVGVIYREDGGRFPRGIGTVRVAYDHGHSRVEHEIRRAALRVLRYQSVATNIPDRATSMSGDHGTFTLATPGVRGAVTGLPEVDEVLARYGYAIDGVGWW